MTAAQAAQVIPSASATTFSTCAEAERLISIASNPIAASFLIEVIVAPLAPQIEQIAGLSQDYPDLSNRLPIAEIEGDPGPDHGHVQDHADAEYRLDSPSSEKLRPPPHHPGLVQERSDRNRKKYRLQPLKPEQAACTQQR